MNLNLFKSTAGKLLERVTLEDKIIEIREIKRFQKIYRWMHFNNDIVQTVIDVKEPHRLVLAHMPVLLDILKFNIGPNEILVMGLGGGALLHYLKRQLPQCNVTIVEIDSTVIALANRHFFLHLIHDNFSIFNADVCDFLKLNGKIFDSIIVDMYDVDQMPFCYHDIQFFQSVYSSLSENGVAAINLVCKMRSEFLEILQKIRCVFNNYTVCIPIKNYMNVIVYAFKAKLQFKQIMQLSQIEFDIEIGLIKY